VTVTVIALWKTPNDLDAFEKHYFSTHVPLVRELPGLKGVNTAKATSGPYFRVAELRFESMDDLGAAFGSEAGQKLMADTGHMQEAFATTADVLTCEVDAAG
jgi:uncharacterized protein (TIGR02118 family)